MSQVSGYELKDRIMDLISLLGESDKKNLFHEIEEDLFPREPSREDLEEEIERLRSEK